jgi:KaiC/GvpD/RAD55 family RecA-like ATPase
LTEILPDDVLTSHRDLLVAGPSEETVRTVPSRLLARAARPDDGAVLVTNREAARTILDRMTREVPTLNRERVGVVDCTPTHDMVRANRRERHWNVPSPVDLTGSLRAVHECLETLDEQGRGSEHLVFDSLTTLLLSADSETVIRYAHQLLLLSGSRTGLALFPVYTNMTDGTDFERLKHLFDGLVRVRRRNGTRQVRCVGIQGTPDEWVTLAETPAASEGDAEAD